MIPQRKPGRASNGNGVSCRMEACRRRLRTVRTNEANSGRDEQAVEVKTETDVKTETLTSPHADNSKPEGQGEAGIIT